MLALDLIILVPLVLAPVAAISSKILPETPRWVALVGALAQLGLLVSLAPLSVFQGAHLTGADMGQMTVAWSTATDGLSTPLVLLTGVVGVLAVAASWRIGERPAAHYALLLIIQSAMAGVFLADSIILFYIAWESVLIPMYLLIAGWGSSNAAAAARRFLVYTFVGGAVLLVGVVYAFVMLGATSISQMTASADLISGSHLLLWLLSAGFLIKVPAIPFHTWLPEAHTEAPTAGSIILAGVLLKMGGYGLMRLSAPLTYDAFGQDRWIFVALGAIGVIWGAASALVQTDLKRLVAYSSVAHMGFVLVAIGTATPASLGAASVTMFSHGLVASVLFFLVGALYQRAHTRELSAFRGLGSTMPVWSVLFVVAALASAGLPGLSGFPGELVTILEAWHVNWFLVVALGVGVVLAAAYNLRAVRETVQGVAPPDADYPDLDSREWGSVVLMLALSVGVGVAPWLVSRMGTTIYTTIALLVRGAGS